MDSIRIQGGRPLRGKIHISKQVYPKSLLENPRFRNHQIIKIHPNFRAFRKYTQVDNK